tara:strand:+ start:444 stop:1646 length:1203 start_codon:yes stop_codon:yes gene_type:complete
MRNLKETITEIINETEIFDIHTHLFPAEFKKYHLSGISEVLNYHYLIAELFTTTNVNVKKFYKLTNKEKANIIWKELFQKRTPISEACKGVLTILSELSIDYMFKSFDEIDSEYSKLNLSDLQIFKISKISKVVMTNNPYDKSEWELFRNKNWDTKKYLASLRLDDILMNLNKCLDICKENIENFNNENDLIIKYLDKAYKESKPVYAALSLNNFQLNSFLNNKFIPDILKWLEKKNIPLSLLLGVRRQVNKDFLLAGDGIDRIDLHYLSEICNKYPNNKILCSCLSFNDQHELTVLARKHQNLKIFGFWWFMNQPSLITLILNLRIELLGLNFIPQHSDARITDQLIYKWIHFKSLLSDILYKHYNDIQLKSFKISENQISDDVSKLLFKNSQNILNLS